MSETKEMQSEEREALASIYEGDNFFKQVNGETFQYKVIRNPSIIEEQIISKLVISYCNNFSTAKKMEVNLFC